MQIAVLYVLKKSPENLHIGFQSLDLPLPRTIEPMANSTTPPTCCYHRPAIPRTHCSSSKGAQPPSNGPIYPQNKIVEPHSPTRPVLCLSLLPRRPYLPPLVTVLPIGHTWKSSASSATLNLFFHLLFLSATTYYL